MLILSRGRVKKYDICHLNSYPPPIFGRLTQFFFKNLHVILGGKFYLFLCQIYTQTIYRGSINDSIVFLIMIFFQDDCLLVLPLKRMTNVIFISKTTFTFLQPTLNLIVGC